MTGQSGESKHSARHSGWIVDLQTFWLEGVGCLSFSTRHATRSVQLVSMEAFLAEVGPSSSSSTETAARIAVCEAFFPKRV